jgi:hypothetical protein
MYNGEMITAKAARAKERSANYKSHVSFKYAGKKNPSAMLTSIAMRIPRFSWPTILPACISDAYIWGSSLRLLLLLWRYSLEVQYALNE